jgi:hypothetical protein
MSKGITRIIRTTGPDATISCVRMHIVNVILPIGARIANGLVPGVDWQGQSGHDNYVEHQMRVNHPVEVRASARVSS